jgi:hypothetical protein
MMKFCVTLLLLYLSLLTATSIQCDYFNATICTGEDTNFALKNYGVCQFDACGGDDVVVTTRSATNDAASCSGDTYMRLIDTDGDLLGYSDDATWQEICSEIIFSLPVEYACQTYESRIGCFGSDTDCAAQVVVNVSGG